MYIVVEIIMRCGDHGLSSTRCNCLLWEDKREDVPNTLLLYCTNLCSIRNRMLNHVAAELAHRVGEKNTRLTPLLRTPVCSARGVGVGKCKGKVRYVCLNKTSRGVGVGLHGKGKEECMPSR